MATLSTPRRCPYCSSEIELGDCPIVATSVSGLEFAQMSQLELDDVELPSGRPPLRLLPKTHWPVLAEAPNADGSAADGSSDRSFLGRTFAGGAGSLEYVLPPLSDGGMPREDVPARACPVCEFPLPQSIDNRPAVVVAVVGVNRVGKTHLLASSLTQAYRREGLAPIGCTEFAPDDSTGKRFLEDYYSPLFHHHTILARTQAEDGPERFQPLVFNVTLPDCEPFSLVLHDVAGEVLGDHRMRARAATYLFGAKGIVFVVDPRDIDDLRESIPSTMVDDEELGWDQGTLLSACLGGDGLLAETGPVPVAIAIAKSDLLPHATGETLRFLEPAPETETRDELYARIRSTSNEVEEFLERYRAHNILRPAREYRRRLQAEGDRVSLTFHAFSALGKAPREIEERGAKVEPVNCLDPLAAILAHV
jgi:hypothetical protein